MSANRTRVQVRGSIGKSVRFPTGTSGSGATIGVNFALPDGSIPTLQQLAAALATGSAIQDQPGNIVPPGGGPTVIWQNVQYIPPNVINPARNVFQEDDAGEEYGRMAVPGPVGLRGFQGFPGAIPDDPEDPGLIPGAAGPTGATGPAGAGSTGAPGVTIPMYPDEPEEALTIPGPPGPVGNTGPAGAGVQGGPGVPIYFTADDPEDPPSPVPGAQGLQGIQGIPGASSSSAGGGGGIMPDDEDVYRPEQASVVGGDLTINGKLTVRGGMVPSDTFTYSYYGGL